VIKSLAEEIQEFEQDKQAVVETKVRLIAGAKDKLAELQQNFIARSAELVKESITRKLESEMTQLKEDIQLARENMFGRQLFEAFASEFAVTHLNENKEIRKLQAVVAAKEQALAEARGQAEHAAMIVESKEKEIRVIKESTERKEILANLLKPLNKEKATVMSELLESVQTVKLQSAYDKYLPAVLNNTARVESKPKAMLNESRVEITGDKSANTAAVEENANNVFEIKRLAGLK
jgi:predicted DNA-binding protein